MRESLLTPQLPPATLTHLTETILQILFRHPQELPRQMFGQVSMRLIPTAQMTEIIYGRENFQRQQNTIIFLLVLAAAIPDFLMKKIPRFPSIQISFWIPGS